MPNVSMDQITMQGVGECVAKVHNTAHFIKTQLPVVPDYDPSAYIEAKMQELNQQVSDEDNRSEDTEDRLTATDLSPYLAHIVEGVR